MFNITIGWEDGEISCFVAGIKNLSDSLEDAVCVRMMQNKDHHVRFVQAYRTANEAVVVRRI